MSLFDRLLWTTGIASALLFIVLALMGEIWLKAGGIAVFDGRIAGYSWESAQAYLAAMSTEQSNFYRRVFQKIDTWFPALLTFTMIGVIWRQSFTALPILRAIGTVLPLVYLGLDYTENLAVAQMLQAGPGVQEDLVRWASGATISKWIALTIAMIVTVWAWRRAPGDGEGAG